VAIGGEEPAISHSEAGVLLFVSHIDFLLILQQRAKGKFADGYAASGDVQLFTWPGEFAAQIAERHSLLASRLGDEHGTRNLAHIFALELNLCTDGRRRPIDLEPRELAVNV